ncbi:MAG: rRNA maturation RNase YbeY [Puniceicoccales bacterium]|nr:rRNA maturation RNase YbeY [Puniceicoccales bacterium]
MAIYSPLGELQFSQKAVALFIAAIDAMGRYSIPSGELSIALLDDGTMAAMHGKFLSDPTPTDVITFPGNPAERFAGEICIAVGYAARSAKEHGVPLGDEIALYLVHGWLHLAGLDDATEEGAALMRSAEKELLDHARMRDLIPNFRL